MLKKKRSTSTEEKDNRLSQCNLGRKDESKILILVKCLTKLIKTCMRVQEVTKLN